MSMDAGESYVSLELFLNAVNSLHRQKSAHPAVSTDRRRRLVRHPSRSRTHICLALPSLEYSLFAHG